MELKRKPVAMIQDVMVTEAGILVCPIVLCDDGSVFQLMPPQNPGGRRTWEPCPVVPGTPQDPARGDD